LVLQRGGRVEQRLASALAGVDRGGLADQAASLGAVALVLVADDGGLTLERAGADELVAGLTLDQPLGLDEGRGGGVELAGVGDRALLAEGEVDLGVAVHDEREAGVGAVFLQVVG